MNPYRSKNRVRTNVESNAGEVETCDQIRKSCSPEISNGKTPRIVIILASDSEVMPVSTLTGPD